ncbi:hypothetical protein B0H17DRAFT_1251811 [Mycena rosella]|uniref:NmrA-like domain-containing protein n=1 Tax=Mycena rosella TaxID=1033263 RepID=A0AAD7CXQ5_MYCRO|nr:hypothetical protein B0H17DRAFT_1251811 [Mycena rosella]
MSIIAIFGTTGSQGSAILNAVLADGKYTPCRLVTIYTPRAVSRTVDSDKSKALIAKGIEVKANLFDAESAKAAIRGSEAVFGVCTYSSSAWARRGKNLVDAAKDVGVKFFIWSSLPNVTKETSRKYTYVYHADNKALIEGYLRTSGMPHAVLLTGVFAENLRNFGSLQKTGTEYTIPVPKYGPEDAQSATWVAHDFDAAAVALLSNYKDATKGVLRNAFPVVSMKFTYPQLAAAIAAEVTFMQMDTAGLAELDEMAKIGMYPTTGVPNPALVALGVKFGSMEEFIKKEVVPGFL